MSEGTADYSSLSSSLALAVPADGPPQDISRDSRGLVFLKSYACSLCPRTLVVGCHLLGAIIADIDADQHGPTSGHDAPHAGADLTAEHRSVWYRYGLNLIYRCVLSRINQFFDIGPHGALFADTDQQEAVGEGASRLLTAHRCVMEPVAIALSKICWVSERVSGRMCVYVCV